MGKVYIMALLISVAIILTEVNADCDVTTEKDECCVFPFKYKGITHDFCTFKDSTKPWCSLTSDYNGKWGYCKFKTCQIKTTDGECCVFPFKFGWVTYQACTMAWEAKPWCGTNAVVNAFTGKPRGYCRPYVEPCFNNPCQNNGVCQSDEDQFHCICAEGYTGEKCSEDIDECASSPCVNGECIDGVNSYECICEPGYDGKKCANNIDECSSSPCVNGKCIDGVNSYDCKCEPGYNGEKCENNIDECASSPCVNGECIDGVNLYECKCEPGYDGKKCANKIDECAASPCVNGECIGGLNSYQCKCKPGYEGKDCENLIRKPSNCASGNWWSSFNSRGWSTCGKNNLFITRLYRSAPVGNTDPLYLLEAPACCNAMPLLSSKEGECKTADWWKSFDTNNKWSLCPSGYFLNGFYRNTGQELHNVENGNCCRPKNHPDKYGHCYDEDVSATFDKAGWSGCTNIGHYITGFYRGSGADWLSNIDKFRCCEMSTAQA